MENNALVNIKSRKAKADRLKATICGLLQWDDLTYAEFQYDMGLFYLRQYIPQDKWGQDLLQRTRLFWNWWKTQWTNRDDAYLSVNGESLQCISLENRRRIYRHLHDAGTLASEIYPGRVVLEDTYNEMIASLIKTEAHA